MMQDLDNDMERLVGEAAMEAPSLFYYTQYDLEKSVQTYASYYIPITIIIIIIIIISNALIIKHHLISHHPHHCHCHRRCPYPLYLQKGGSHIL